jgi:hypothetical protein
VDVRTFAGIGPGLVESFLERVELAGAGKVAAALERWRELELEGWDVTALGAVDGSHLIGLGFRYRPLAVAAGERRAC